MESPITHSDLETFALRIERHIERECESIRREVGTSIDALTDRMDKQNGRVNKLEDRALAADKELIRHDGIIEQVENRDIWELIPTKGKVFLGMSAFAFLGDFTSHVPFQMVWDLLEKLL